MNVPIADVRRSIPIYTPDFSGNERAYLIDAFDSGWLSWKGRYVDDFEDAFASVLGVSHCTSVCNGTAALQVALDALEIGPGDEVIVPAFTYVASANTVIAVGGTPVFADSVSDTWQVDPEDVERRITNRTKAIMAVHLYGGACDLDALSTLARRRGIYLIEDCAEGLGTLYKGKFVGQYGDIAAFSFYANKTITTGEGGMVATDRPELIEKAFLYKTQGVSRSREYWHETLGYNFRMTNLAAAIGLAQLERLEDFLTAKRRIAGWYEEYLRGTPVRIQGAGVDVLHSYWLVSLVCPCADDVFPLREALRREAIETRPVFPPMNTLPIYHARERLPVAEDIACRGLSLPSWPGLSENDVCRICRIICTFYSNR